MGYALLYESMLDSVLVARDRFLRPAISDKDGQDGEGRPAGVLAPSQTRMLLSLCDGKEVHKERVGFWNDVYGTLLRIIHYMLPYSLNHQALT